MSGAVYQFGFGAVVDGVGGAAAFFVGVVP